MGVDNANVARRYMNEIWGKGNLEAVDELVDENIVLRDPMTPELAGLDNFKQRVKEMQSTFSENNFTLEDVIVAGDRVIVLHSWSCKHTGDMAGLKPTGKTITGKAAEVLRLRNGKVVENISYMDMYGMYQQLGLVPPHDQLEKQASATQAAEPASAPLSH